MSCSCATAYAASSQLLAWEANSGAISPSLGNCTNNIVSHCFAKAFIDFVCGARRRRGRSGWGGTAALEHAVADSAAGV